MICFRKFVFYDLSLILEIKNLEIINFNNLILFKINNFIFTFTKFYFYFKKNLDIKCLNLGKVLLME